MRYSLAVYAFQSSFSIISIIEYVFECVKLRKSRTQHELCKGKLISQLL